MRFTLAFEQTTTSAISVSESQEMQISRGRHTVRPIRKRSSPCINRCNNNTDVSEVCVFSKLQYQIGHY